MKKAIKIFCMSIVVTFLYATGFIISSSIPPSDGYSQTPANGPDSLMSLADAKALLNTAEQNIQVAKAMESVKTKRQVIVKDRKVYVPIIVRRSATVVENKKKPETIRSRPSVTIIYEAPKYSNSETRYLNFSQWRLETGEKSEKKYREYLKSLNVIK